MTSPPPNLERILLGQKYLSELPRGASRAQKLVSFSPPLKQDLCGIITEFLGAIRQFPHVTIATGFPIGETFETDGPIGTYILGNLLIQHEVGVAIVSEAPVVAVMQKFPWKNTGKSDLEFIDSTDIHQIDSVFVSIERPGQNGMHVCHNMRGEDISHKLYSFEKLIATSAPPFWLAIGDGGNELGLGSLKARVAAAIPFGGKCQCGCGGSIAAELGASRVLLGLTSNFASLIAALEIARQMGWSFGYSWDQEQQIIGILNRQGIVDGVTGQKGTIDGIAKPVAKVLFEEALAVYGL